MLNSILITGGCGFIGTSLIPELLKINPNLNIRILDNFSTGTPNDLARVTQYTLKAANNCTTNLGVELVNGDIRDENMLLLCSKNVDCIIHLAANTGVQPSVANPRIDMEANIIGTFNALEAARINHVDKFIFASSGAPAGEVNPPIHEELAPHPVSPYGASKLAGEGYCSAYYKTFGINTICLRFGNVYGPSSKHKSSIVAKFIRQALSSEVCFIYGDGTQTRDFIYIDDLVQAILCSIDKDIGGETFQIAMGKEQTINEISTLIAKLLEYHDVKMITQCNSPKSGDVKRNYSDVSKAKTILGWEANTNIEIGINNTIDYFMKINAQ
ncbi:NAD-dependent epimerase/dehydratase family protein [Candidatus Venteria ishoeyi]|uniref:UDP-glucose 4-epimerase n=1 Tax=Candidatus Venteria ishoeyi TaxID=1899563 RepID=A0A1H6FG15_9GAMM|nr:NAD-dependent epimerase/dehydratase family protein [Candidatus Venteria ishoeyi]SEH08279.1 UDP-glucose 4-epimerase [Candidatus Venteria ishoeyi]